MRADGNISAAWRPIVAADAVGGRSPMLVTNNLKARDAHGGMSHVWISFVIEASDPEITGPYVGYDGDRLLHNLTHCMPVPVPAENAQAPDAGIRSEPPISSPAGALTAEKADRPMCECPNCGRMHWSLGKPPSKPLPPDLEEKVRAYEAELTTIDPNRKNTP